MLDALHLEDIDPDQANSWDRRAAELDAAWAAKELLRLVCHARRRRPAARRALSRFYTHVADHDHIPELVTLATTISAWESAATQDRDPRFGCGLTRCM